MNVFELVGTIVVKIDDAIKNLDKVEDAAEDTSEGLKDLGDSSEKSGKKVSGFSATAKKLFDDVMSKKSESVKDAAENIEDLGESSEKTNNKVSTFFTKVGQLFELFLKKSSSVKDTNKRFEELSDTISEQESKLSELKNKYSDLYLTQGETSDEAKETASEIEKLSKSLKENKEKLAEAESAADKFDKSIDEVGNTTEDTESKMTAALKKIGKAVIAAFAVDKIKDFTLACIDAASNAEATGAQFSQVFGDLEETASKDLSQIADSAGILENRMKNSYTKIAAFAKTTGMDTKDALSLADRAMIVVADSAAFYDRTLENTTESLQSFLKGNYENDAALGLSCTETTRNAAANKLYGKSFKDLSEAQKQLTLLQMVEDANAASGALGQAAREADTWTNQTGNLQQAWTNFQATLGSNILPLAVQMVKKLSDAVQKMSDFTTNTLVPCFESIKQKVKELTEWYEKNKTWVDLLVIAVGSIVTGMLAYAAAMGTVELVTKAVAAAQTLLSSAMLTSPFTWIVAAIVAAVAAFLYFWNTSEGFRNFWINLWNTIKSAVSSAVDWIKSAWNSIKNAWGSAVEFFTSVVDGIKNAWGSVTGFFEDIAHSITSFFVSAWDGIKVVWNSVTGFFEGIWSSIVNGVSNLVSKVIGFFLDIANWIITNIVTPISQFWDTWIQPIVDKLMEIGAKVIEIIAALFVGLKNLFLIFWASVIQWLQSIWDKIVEIFSMCVDWVNENIISPIIAAIQTFIDTVIDFFTQLWNSIVNIFMSVCSWVDTNIISPISAAIQAFIDAVINFFTQLWNGIVSIFTVACSWVDSNIITPISTAVAAFFTTILGIARNAWNGIKNIFSVVGSFFKSVFQSAYNAVTSIFNKIGAFFSTLWNKIKNNFTKLGTNISEAIGSAVKSGLNGVISFIEKTINRGISLINGAINLINLLPGVSVGKISNLSLPRLAKGGVLERGQVGVLEGDGAEAVVPLEQNLQWLDRLKQLLTPIVTASMGALTSSIPTYGGTVSTNNVLTNNNSDVTELLMRILNRLEIMDKTLYDKFVTALVDGVKLETDGREFARMVRKYA